MAPRSRSTSRIADNGADAPVIQRNSLLAKLPEDELESLLDRGKLVTANLREILRALAAHDGGHPRCRRSQESVVRMLRDHSQYGSRAILLIPEQS